MRFLVMYCGEGDDIPVLLTEDKDEADGLARELVSYYEPSRSTEHHPSVRYALAQFGRDVGTYICVGVLSFTAAGLPLEWSALPEE